MRGSLNRHESKMRKGKFWAKWPVQIYNLNFAFSFSVDQKGSLIMKRVCKSTILMVLLSFEVKHRRRILRVKEKGMEEKGMKVKEWFTFLTIVMDRVYL